MLYIPYSGQMQSQQHPTTDRNEYREANCQPDRTHQPAIYVGEGVHLRGAIDCGDRVRRR